MSNLDEKLEKFALYIEKTKNHPPHDTLVKALSYFNSDHQERLAIDLGCGSGRDTLHLLSQGWQVLAIDENPHAKKVIEEQLTPKAGNPNFLCSSFELLDLSPYPKVDLINASYCLPFCSPDHFSNLWELITAHIKDQGIFAGHFFGPQHTWAHKSSMTFHSKEGIRDLFSSFRILSLEEEQSDGHDIDNNDVHWHVFHIVAQKRDYKEGTA